MDAWYSCHENIQEKHSTQTGDPEVFLEEENQVLKDIQY